MNKIKVYDVNAFIEKEYPQYNAFRYEKAAIFEGSRGFVFAEEEAVHQKENLITDSIVIPLCKKPTPGHIAFMASADLTVSFDEIINEAPYQEMDIEDFFKRRNYNPRCQENFATLMKSLRDIGFDLHGYFRDEVVETKNGLKQQISEALNRSEVANNISKGVEKGSETAEPEL